MMYVFLILGFLLLIKGADYFVEASSSVAVSYTHLTLPTT